MFTLNKRRKTDHKILLFFFLILFDYVRFVCKMERNKCIENGNAIELEYDKSATIQYETKAE